MGLCWRGESARGLASRVTRVRPALLPSCAPAPRVPWCSLELRLRCAGSDMRWKCWEPPVCQPRAKGARVNTEASSPRGLPAWVTSEP